MKSFKSILDEDLKSAVQELGPYTAKDLKENYYETVGNLDKLVKLLSQLSLNLNIKDFKKEAELFDKVKKLADKSNLGKYL